MTTKLELKSRTHECELELRVNGLTEVTVVAKDYASALREMGHYVMQYQDDGELSVYLVTRKRIK